MNIYDLCVAWNWIYDADFISLLEKSCQAREISILQVTTSNLPQVLNALVGRETDCRVFFDRASDEDPQFLPLVQWVREDYIHAINAYEHASRTWDKAHMHTVLVSHGLNVPATIILPPYIEQPDIPSVDLSPLGEQFTLKPAHGSGGVGVMTNGSTWEQVLSGRKQHSTDHYLLQAHIAPINVGNHLAWFRIIYCSGQIYPCWWDPFTHIYSPLTENEIIEHGFESLEQVVQVIARLSKLDLFSTEIAYTAEGKFVVVDYVNDQIDLRLQSRTIEGVPDAIVLNVTEQLVEHVIHHRRRNRHLRTMGHVGNGTMIKTEA